MDILGICFYKLIFALKDQRNEKDKSQMYPLLSQYEDSGLSKKEFCKQQGLNQATFWYWWQKYQKSGSEKFVELEGLPLDSGRVEINIGRVRVEFDRLPPVGYLRNLLQIGD